jgi:hypothetical protein
MSQLQPPPLEALAAAQPRMQARSRRRAKAGSLLAWRQIHRRYPRTAADTRGISQTYYSKLERETVHPHPKLAARIRVITGLSLERLLGLAG